jgi:hypothetical protein
MRKVTEQITRAFLNRQKRSVGNSMTDGVTLFLHGNAIAKKRDFQEEWIWITLAGWPTPTTRERLTGLLKATICEKARVFQRDGRQYIDNGRTTWEIDSDEWISLSEIRAKCSD